MSRGDSALGESRKPWQIGVEEFGSQGRLFGVGSIRWLGPEGGEPFPNRTQDSLGTEAVSFSFFIMRAWPLVCEGDWVGAGGLYDRVTRCERSRESLFLA
jgi:hypothetical protein